VWKNVWYVQFICGVLVTLYYEVHLLYLSSSQMYEQKLQQDCNFERWTSLEIPSSVTDTIQGRFRFEIISTLLSFQLSNMWWFIRYKGKPNPQSVIPSMPGSPQYNTKFLEPSYSCAQQIMLNFEMQVSQSSSISKAVKMKIHCDRWYCHLLWRSWAQFYNLLTKCWQRAGSLVPQLWIWNLIATFSILFWNANMLVVPHRADCCQ